ncbi:site-specific integrase [Variovorax sp. RB2P76]|uniref:site-specific integrase n=1 Tax=Variovorax sp. RB2P76 TaxID=3443736 RepID=UPI003F466195
MSTIKANVASVRDSTLAEPDPLKWRWPVVPRFIQVYDKYADRVYSLGSEDLSWIFSHQGDASTIEFFPGEIGALQRRISLLTSAGKSPGMLNRFARHLVAHWKVAHQVLITKPSELRKFWDTHVPDQELAGVLKAMLKRVCECGVGPWNARLLPMVSRLNTRANEGVRRRTNDIESRIGILPAGEQAAIVHAIDFAVGADDLSSDDLEGAAGLALIYQHGIRPVQALCLRLEHVQFFADATDDLACVVSFHSAKQQEGREFEMLRQMKPEWVPLIARLHATAVAEHRQRLFSATSSTRLWVMARSLCKQAGTSLKCTSKDLRRTGAQALADAGHSRKSIQQFLGHATEAASKSYVRASLQQAALINTALGASRLYGSIAAIARGEFVTTEQMLAAQEDEQVGAVIGDSLVAGIGLCKSGQANCSYNPVTSCYGCPKFMPAMNLTAHREAVEGIRQQVRVYLQRGISEDNPAYRQLTRSLAGVQRVIASVERLGEGSR